MNKELKAKILDILFNECAEYLKADHIDEMMEYLASKYPVMYYGCEFQEILADSGIKYTDDYDIFYPKQTYRLRNEFGKIFTFSLGKNPRLNILKTEARGVVHSSEVSFPTLKEAEKFKQKIIASSIDSALITIYPGHRHVLVPVNTNLGPAYANERYIYWRKSYDKETDIL